MLTTDSSENRDNVALLPVPAAPGSERTEMCVIAPLLTSSPAKKTLRSALDKRGKKKEVGREVWMEEHFIAYPEKSHSRIRPLDHRSSKTRS